MTEKQKINCSCEWNPDENMAAVDTDPFHDIAVISVGAKGQWHLCKKCSDLPIFKRFKKRYPIIYGSDVDALF